MNIGGVNYSYAQDTKSSLGVLTESAPMAEGFSSNNLHQSIVKYANLVLKAMRLN